MATGVDSEPNSTKLTIEIWKLLTEAARRRKVDRNDPAIRGLMVRVDQLAQQRSLAAA
ncbi:hypothetical protein [Sphingomonas lenta]|uniref:hypothetical protein n=1 Tax=Sphingomonas lenta TaxID=1141887 RepID=UPI0015952315|nr:hypothetical protein [Sphingomonas lenta]